MTFNIGSQQGNISNVAGNQINYGNNEAHVSAPPEVLAAVRQLVQYVDLLQIQPALRADLKADLEPLDAQMASGAISNEQVGHRLRKFLSLARSAGSVITATSALGTAITTIARWLGPAGASLIQFLT